MNGPGGWPCQCWQDDSNRGTGHQRYCPAYVPAGPCVACTMGLYEKHNLDEHTCPLGQRGAATATAAAARVLGTALRHCGPQRGIVAMHALGQFVGYNGPTYGPAVWGTADRYSADVAALGGGSDPMGAAMAAVPLALWVAGVPAEAVDSLCQRHPLPAAAVVL